MFPLKKNLSVIFSHKSLDEKVIFSPFCIRFTKGAKLFQKSRVQKDRLLINNLTHCTETFDFDLNYLILPILLCDLRLKKLDLEFVEQERIK
jgi:hypothetical protein